MNFVGLMIRTVDNNWVYMLGLVDGDMHPIMDIDLMSKKLNVEYGTLWNAIKVAKARTHATGDGDYENEYAVTFECDKMKYLIDELDAFILPFRMAAK